MSKKRRASLKAELFVTILFFAGLAVFAYPFVARAVNTLTLSARVTRDRKKAEANVKRQQAKIKLWPSKACARMLMFSPKKGKGCSRSKRSVST